jgi:hypothetical protein
MLLQALRPNWLHHGDCIGVDSEAHINCKSLSPNTLIHIHPPTATKYRAYCKADTISVPKAYLERNRDIVDEIHMLIAIPETEEEVVRSGTWATVRYAGEREKPVMIIRPDGSITWRW